MKFRILLQSQARWVLNYGCTVKLCDDGVSPSDMHADLDDKLRLVDCQTVNNIRRRTLAETGH